MNYELGMKVLLNGKLYKIVGTVKRSWILEKGGNQYKATSKMMNQIKEQNDGIRKTRTTRKKRSTNHMADRLRYRRIFDKTMNMPETKEECMYWLDMILSELSPENLHCDGEISRSAAMTKARKLRAEWREVEVIIGHKVSEGDAESWSIAKWRAKNKR